MKVLAKGAAALAALTLFGFAAATPSSLLNLPVEEGRGSPSIDAQADAAVRAFARKLAAMSAEKRQQLIDTGHWHTEIPFSMPIVVRPYEHGQPLPPGGGHRGPGDIVLAFDTTGPYVFPAQYKSLLQSVYASAKPFMDQVFGPASMGGTVYVRNYDANIGDREAIAGGYYLQNNGNDQREIRFPVYSSPEAAAVNLIHCILLAYLGADGYAFDPFQEGFVRGAVLAIARTPGALPGSLTTSEVEAVLDNTYDRSETYDWLNQRALGGPYFIAPNFKGGTLPPSGGTGLFLTRYAMGGTCWAKLLEEYPQFISAFNAAVYTDPALGSNVAGLLSLGQQVLNAQRPGNPTVEGMSFSEWARRQFILECGLTQGDKLFLDAVPVTDNLAGTDFGVFILDATWFNTDGHGDESLLDDTAYPIYFDDSFNRVFPSVQDNQILIQLGDGTGEPNIPDLGIGPYRAMVDLPVRDQIARVVLPAGDIQTAQMTAPNDFFGTVEDAILQTNDSLYIRLYIDGHTYGNIPVTNGAFGSTIGSSEGYDENATLTVSVYKHNSGGNTLLMTRTVDKLPGPLALRLRVGTEGTYTYNPGLQAGIQTIGFPFDPFSSLQPTILGIPGNQVQTARFNPTRGVYDLYPSLEPFKEGHGFFVRMASAKAFSVEGRTTNMPFSIALKPGWNQISTPFATAVPATQVSVIHTTDFPISYSAAIGTLIGTTFFRFSPGEKDPYSGVPETGSMVPVTSFNPGVAYFIRNLSSDVVTLLFTPTVQGRLADPPPGTRVTFGGPIIFRMAVRATDGTHATYADIGETETSTDGFDPLEDSGIPTGDGGLQATSIGGTNPLFRDMRRWGGTEVWTIQFTGLRVGRRYQVQTALEEGHLSGYDLFDHHLNYRVHLTPGQSYGFTASSSTMLFDVRVLGRR